jgi:dihydropyrimidine dehydrogenase (NAD+) subunit PreA
MNLKTEYLGLELINPFVLASGPAAANGEMIARAFEAGWAGAVIKTLISEPVLNLHNRFASKRLGGKLFAFENIELLSEQPPDQWYQDIRELKRAFPDRAVIGSIMGDAKEPGPWIDLALGCQEAGADLLELNFSCPHGYPEKGKGAAIGQEAEFTERITGWLTRNPEVKIPIVPKLTAAVADISHIGQAAADAGAQGLSAINTIPSIMGIDLKTLLPRPTVAGRTTPGGMSGPAIKPIALRCISDLVKSPGLPVMACGGISTGFDAAEFLLLGAPLVQVCTAVMVEGVGIVERMEKELGEFMGWHGFDTISQFLGKVEPQVGTFADLDPGYRVRAEIDTDGCIGCGDCVTSCRDAGYQAVALSNEKATIDGEKCQGCSLCFQVCENDAVRMIETAGA